MTIAEWKQTGLALLKAEGSMNWELGDWFNSGKSFIAPGTSERETDEAIMSLFPSPADRRRTLYTCAWVARRVPSSRRSELLSWSHHREVAPLDAREQTRWLKAAAEKDLSVVELRVAIGGNDRPDRTPLAWSPGRVARDCVRHLRDADAWEPERRLAVLREFASLHRLLGRLYASHAPRLVDSDPSICRKTLHSETA